jgi:hypothetical protein
MVHSIDLVTMMGAFGCLVRVVAQRSLVPTLNIDDVENNHMHIYADSLRIITQCPGTKCTFSFFLPAIVFLWL